MVWKAAAGSALLIQTDPQNKHLFAILHDPMPFPGLGNSPMCVFVNITSATSHRDRTCVLAQGCHQFVTHESVIAYKYARIEEAAILESAVTSGKFISAAPIDHALRLRILNGLLISPHTSGEYRGYAKQIPKT